ncbi:MAG TPA: S8/S53 family peptidase, partial [Gemmatimonadales bacterium]|nr:S8/S53 family peptidase [Gemmatimonadales bacterium]
AVLQSSPTVDLLKFMDDPLPLLVMSAGNGAHDARFSSPRAAALDPDVRPYVVIVGGVLSFGPDTLLASIDTSRSNTGNLVDVFAPGLVNLPDPSGTPGNHLGTSFSAPIVTGIAGLLLTLNPNLDPPTLRQFIISGAASGGTRVTDAGASTPRYVVNAYESLKAASHAPGARGVGLCGNRLYTDALGGVWAERGSPTDNEELYLGEDLVSMVQSFHGGRRLRGTLTDPTNPGYNNYSRDFVFTGTSWVGVTPPNPEPDSKSGSWNSFEHLTHDADSISAVQEQFGPGQFDYDYNWLGYVTWSGYYVGPTPPRFDVWLGVGNAGSNSWSARQLATLSVTLAGPTSWEPRSRFQDSTGAWAVDDSVPANPTEYLFAQELPSPASDRVYLVVNRYRETLILDSIGVWKPCSPSATTCMDRAMTIHGRSTLAEVYSIPWAASAVTLGAANLLVSRPDSVFVSFGVSEDGSEIILQERRDEYSASFPPTGESLPAADCVNLFVSTATGGVVRSVPRPCFINFAAFSPAISRLSRPPLQAVRASGRAAPQPPWTWLNRLPGPTKPRR